jgi:membrane-bound lytic murein transglycosylase MltF
MHKNSALLALILSVGSTFGACGAEKAPPPNEPVKGATEALMAEPAPRAAGEAVRLEDMQSRLGISVLTEPWSGDLAGMKERRVIRLLTVYGLPRYYFDGPQERGLVYEIFSEFDKFVNRKLGTGHLKVYVVFLPVSRDELISGLLEGRGDIAAAGLTITPERLEQVDFSDPYAQDINEVLVTGPTAPPIESAEDLAGQRVDVRESSSYYHSLQKLSDTLVAAGKPAIDFDPISDLLEDEDLMEMVNNGLLPWMVVDDYKPQVMAKAFPDLTVRKDIVLRSGGKIGFAFRKNSPELAAMLNEFISSHRRGTLFGNVLINRYLRDFDFVNNSLTDDHYARFAELEEIFRQYGEQYGVDYLLAAAQGYQESRLDQSLRSDAGAIGVMQLLPQTASDPSVGVPDIHQVGPNIHAGVKYLDHMREEYFPDLAGDRLNQTLMAIASYNAGPNRIRRLRLEAAKMGLDPNRWFGNVEVVAARDIGRETVQYVANIYKYYIAYRLTAAQVTARAKVRRAARDEEPR